METSETHPDRAFVLPGSMVSRRDSRPVTGATNAPLAPLLRWRQEWLREPAAADQSSLRPVPATNPLLEFGFQMNTVEDGRKGSIHQSQAAVSGADQTSIGTPRKEIHRALKITFGGENLLVGPAITHIHNFRTIVEKQIFYDEHEQNGAYGILSQGRIETYLIKQKPPAVLIAPKKGTRLPPAKQQVRTHPAPLCHYRKTVLQDVRIVETPLMQDPLICLP